MQRTSLLAAAVIAAACVSSVVSAHSPIENEPAGDLAQLVERSNLVFVGQAEKIIYRNAPGATGEGIVPHTFVTYRVKQVLRGQAPGERFTMRFVGGPDGSGRILTVSGVPVIQPGDEDLLFVSDTANPACPLVFCERGRFRILNNQVFDTHGSPVRGLAKNKVISRGMPPQQFQRVRYPAPSFDELMKNPEAVAQLKAQNIAPAELRARYERSAPKFIELDEQLVIPQRTPDQGMTAAVALSTAGPSDPNLATRGIGQPLQTAPLGSMAPTMVIEPPPAIAPGPMSLPEFAAATQRTGAQSRKQPMVLKSVDPNAPFVAAPFNITPPQGAATVIPPRGAMSQADVEELKALQGNGFNPVLRR